MLARLAAGRRRADPDVFLGQRAPGGELASAKTARICDPTEMRTS